VTALKTYGAVSNLIAALNREDYPPIFRDIQHIFIESFGLDSHGSSEANLRTDEQSSLAIVIPLDDPRHEKLQILDDSLHSAFQQSLKTLCGTMPTLACTKSMVLFADWFHLEGLLFMTSKKSLATGTVFFTP
jgi:hypothetical protein